MWSNLWFHFSVSNLEVGVLVSFSNIFWDSSVLSHVTVVWSFSLLHSVLVLKFTTLYLPIILSIDILFSSFCILGNMLLWSFLYIYFFDAYQISLVLFCLFFLFKESNFQWRLFCCVLLSISGTSEFSTVLPLERFDSSLPVLRPFITYWFSISGLPIVCPVLHKLLRTQLWTRYSFLKAIFNFSIILDI